MVDSAKPTTLEADNSSALWRSGHVIQFYESDEYLANSVSEFIRAGLEAHDACIVIATPQHRASFAQRVRATGIDLAAASARGDYVALDDAEMLARLMVANTLDAERFAEIVGNLVIQARQGRQGPRHVRIFGEMVRLLWADGNQDAAIRLEELWNDLNTRLPDVFTLRCAYLMCELTGEVNGAPFAEVCAQHSQVIPDESFTDLTSEDERERAVSHLQRQARSLKVEVAERQAAEERLRLSEHLYRRLFESSADGILMVDTTTLAITAANSAIEALLGVTVDQVIGQELWQIGLFADREAMLEVARELEHQRASHYETLRLRASNGESRYIDFVSVRFQVDGHDMIQCSLRDITDRKQAERLLAEHNQLLELIASGHPLDECLIEVTSAVARLQPHTRGVALLADGARERFASVFAADLAPSFERGLPDAPINEHASDAAAAAVHSGQPIDCADIAHDERWAPAWRELCVAHGILGCHAEPVIGPSGQSMAAIMLCFDTPRLPSAWERRIAQFGSHVASIVIERDRAAQALRASEEHYRALTELSPQLIFLAAPDGHIVFVNHSVLEFTGTTLDELREQGWEKVIHPDDVDERASRWRRAIEMGEPFSCEQRLRRADGAYRWHISRAEPLRDGAGAISMWIGAHTDIDEQKQLEARKDAFISMASHELKTPVTSLKGFTQVLQRRLQRSDADPQTLQFLERMDAQLNKLTNLISDILDVSRMREGTLTFRETRFDFDELAREIVENVQAAVTTHQVRLDGATNTQVVGDRDRVGQILINLLTNAIKYSPQADTVVVRLGAAAGRVEVAVQDFGIGIAEEYHERIFEPFYQVAEPREDGYTGLGIGLYIARTFVERHDGRLWVEGRKGAGSTFHFTVPAAPASADDACPAESTLPSERAEATQ